VVVVVVVLAVAEVIGAVIADCGVLTESTLGDRTPEKESRLISVQPGSHFDSAEWGLVSVLQLRGCHGDARVLEVRRLYCL
jgi:hypothetical protein